MLKRLLSRSGLRLFGLILFGLMSWLVLTTAVTYAANGTGPGDALSPNGHPQTVGAHSALWYHFDLGGKKSAVTATVDDNHANGIRLAIYTPEEISNWQSGNGLHAIGDGSAAQGHDLGWTGQFHAAGTYYAVAYNDSDAAVSVSVKVSGDAVTLPSATNSAAPLARTNPTTASQLVSTQASASESISGKLVFVDAAGGNVYTVNGDGTNLQRVSFGLDPQWSHDGTQIALARQGPVPGIYIINADGSNERLLYQTNEPRSPDWSPDDSEIVFSYLANVKGGGQEAVTFRGKTFSFTQPETAQWRLKIVNVADKSTTDPVATNDALTPTWNANGTTIAFNDLSIGIMQTVTNAATGFAAFPFVGDLRITSPGYNPLRLMSPQYSPDGSKIVYVVQQQPMWQIAVASLDGTSLGAVPNADGSGQHLLTSDDVLADTHPNNVAPVWSPDGKQILFLSNRNGKWEFFVMDADRTNVHQVLKSVTDQIMLSYSYNSDRMMSWTE